jgi:hypothetical protein
LEDLGQICGGIRVVIYNTRSATVAVGVVHAEKVERGAARVAGSRGTPAAGLRPRPTREKDFLLISCLIRLIHLLSLNREDYLTPKQRLDLVPKPNPNGPQPVGRGALVPVGEGFRSLKSNRD